VITGIQPRDVPVAVLYNLDPDWTAGEQTEVEQMSEHMAQALAAEGHAVCTVSLSDQHLTAALAELEPSAQVVFNWCESYPCVPHSEPLVARDLENAGFVYTGAPASAIAIAQDKAETRELLSRHGILTPEGRIFRRAVADGWQRYPAIVKAAWEHGSQGLCRKSVVVNERELLSRIEYIFDTFRQPALVEDFIDGREFHVSLVGNGRLEIFPVVEMDYSGLRDFHDHLCSYEAKFVPGSRLYRGIRTVVPAPLTKDELARLEAVCHQAYRAVGCRDYGRIDVRQRDGRYYVLDVNPNADMSADASLAYAAEVAGYSYGQLVSRIVRLAAHRHDWRHAASGQSRSRAGAAKPKARHRGPSRRPGSSSRRRSALPLVRAGATGSGKS